MPTQQARTAGSLRGLGNGIGCLARQPNPTPAPALLQVPTVDRGTVLAEWLSGISSQIAANLNGSRCDDAMTLHLCRRNMRVIMGEIDAWAGGAV